MNFCIWHCEHSILRLLHYIVILLIANILHNYESELEILILVVLSYCGVSNMVSRRPSFQFIFIQIFFCLITANIWKIIFVHCGEETNINDPRSYEHYCTSSWNKTWKKIQARTGFEPMTSATPVQRSINWANEPTGSWSKSTIQVVNNDLLVFHLFYTYCHQIIICTFFSGCGEIAV